MGLPLAVGHHAEWNLHAQGWYICWEARSRQGCLPLGGCWGKKTMGPAALWPGPAGLLSSPGLQEPTPWGTGWHDAAAVPALAPGMVALALLMTGLLADGAVAGLCHLPGAGLGPG